MHPLLAMQEYNQMKERVFAYERVLLKTFGFIIHADHPHKFVMSYVHLLEGDSALAQTSWSILNDSMRTTLCVRFRGETVACGAVYMAARKLQVRPMRAVLKPVYGCLVSALHRCSSNMKENSTGCFQSVVL